jgi:hypothetical protein
MMENHDRVPCCAADALRRIRKIPVNGIPTGINRLDESIAAVQESGLADESAIRAAPLEHVRAGNHIPPAMEGAYAAALLEEYRRTSGK